MQVNQYEKLLSQKPCSGSFDGLYLLPPKPDRMEQIARTIVRYLRTDCRMSLTKMACETGIPVSTLHDHIQRLRKHYHFRLRLEPKDADDG